MSISINLSGKTAAVTGGARGLGKAIALTLARAGANVLICSRTESECKKTAEEISALGVKGEYMIVDVYDPAQVEAFTAKAVEMGGGKLDIFVNDAGVVDTTPWLDITLPQIERLFNINIIGVSNAIQSALRVMIPQKEGRIVIIPSIAGRNGSVGSLLPHYAASKAAAINLLQSAALLAAPAGVNVNGVAPGIIRTQMWENILEGWGQPEGSQQRDDYYSGVINGMIPTKRDQSPQDIADCVLFLCSDLAKEIVGQTINVDGGVILN